MNFQDEKEREAMATFARTGVYDFVEDHLNEDESEEQIDSSIIETEEEDETKSLVWALEKRFNITPTPRSENRFKSFRRSYKYFIKLTPR